MTLDNIQLTKTKYFAVYRSILLAFLNNHNRYPTSCQGIPSRMTRNS